MYRKLKQWGGCLTVRGLVLRTRVLAAKWEELLRTAEGFRDLWRGRRNTLSQSLSNDGVRHA
ncbi:MAG: hypothetical protein ACO2PN_14840 [Pyrobaculum sp.]|jgi:hypothetical protein